MLRNWGLVLVAVLAGCSLGDDEKPYPRISPIVTDSVVVLAPAESVANAVTSAAAEVTTLATTTTTVEVPVTCGADADEQHPPPCD